MTSPRSLSPLCSPRSKKVGNSSPLPSRRPLFLLSLAFLFLLRPVPPILAQSFSHYSFSSTLGGIIATNGSPFYGKSPSFGVDAAIYRQQKDSSLFWVQYWDYPLFGIRANYAHIVNAIAGDRFGITALIESPLVGNLNWTYSAGLSFYTSPYSLTHDPQNIYIGSLVNCLLDLGLVYTHPLSSSSSLIFTGKIVHSSNGYLYKPNRGLNYLQLDIGLRLGPTRSLPSLSRQRTDTTFRAHGHPFFMLAPGAVMSRYDPLDSIRYYPTYTFQLGYRRHVHPCFSYGLALDLSYNFSHRRLSSPTQWPVYPAFSIFSDSHYGPLTLRLGLAHYLGLYPLNWEQYYERVALYIRPFRRSNHQFGVGMKVHYDHIDFIEWSYIFEL